MLTRRGLLDFPMPIGSKGSRLRWRKEDLESWSSRVGNIPEQQPATEVETPTARRQRDDKVARELKKLGLNINKTKGE